MKQASFVLFLILIMMMSDERTAHGGDYSVDAVLRAPDGTTVTVYRDGYGVPHIVGESESGVFFGQGYAVARDRLFQMEYLRRASEGRLAEWYGAAYIGFDREIRRMFYSEEERTQHFLNLPAELQVMLASYRDGVNTYLDSMRINPSKFKPLQFAQYQIEPWTVNKSIAIMQVMIRNFGQSGGDELTRLGELQDHGQVWFDLYRPLNDPGAPTTIPAAITAKPGNDNYSGIFVRKEVIDALEIKDEKLKEQMQNLRLPTKFGSFSALISGVKSNSGNVMLLGCPQMGEPAVNEPQINNEVELQCPTMHVGGMTIAGIPLVIIGHNEHHAWTLTSGLSDNSDVYIDSTSDNSYNKYYYNEEWLDFEVIQDSIYNLENPIPFTHYRTVHGPVFGDDLANHQVFSLKMTFWDHELDMIKFIYGVIKADDLTGFETAAAMNPMSFNLSYAGNDQKIKFWHTGKYQDRTDGVDPRLPHKGDGSEEWGGFIAFNDQPVGEDPLSGYFVNWNNKPVAWWDNGDNIPWVGPHHVSNIATYVGPINGFSYNNLKDIPEQINSHGTYQQAIEISTIGIIDENILPPGQSGFIDLNGTPSLHFTDQWQLHLNWEFKDMEFGQNPAAFIHRDHLLILKFLLCQNYPNPFNPSTTIEFTLPKSEVVNLKIFNLLGEEITTLVNKRLPAGNHTCTFDGTNLANGVYYYQLLAGGYKQIRKMMLIK